MYIFSWEVSIKWPYRANGVKAYFEALKVLAEEGLFVMDTETDAETAGRFPDG